MDNQIYLLSVGFQLNTFNVETNLGDSAKLSNMGPVLVLSLIMDLEGQISLTTTVEYESTTDDDILIGVKKIQYLILIAIHLKVCFCTKSNI